MKTKLMTIIAMCIMVTATAFAQTSEKMHKIEKGETIESIAQKYGVTVEDIQKANPNAGGYFFTGMSIKIPEKVDANEGKTTTEMPVAITEENTMLEQVDTDNKVFNNLTTKDPCSFNFTGATYIASFEAADKGAYYFNWQIFSSSGWGAEFGLGANYGLIESDYAGVFFRAGGAYGYAITDKILLSTSFCFEGNYHGTGEYIESGYSNSNANWGGHYYEVTRKGDLKFDWGLSFNPQIVFKMGKMLPHAGLSFNWSQGTKKIDVGFIVGVGF